MTLNEFTERVMGEDEELCLITACMNLIDDAVALQRLAVVFLGNEEDEELFFCAADTRVRRLMREVFRIVNALGYNAEDLAYEIVGE